MTEFIRCRKCAFLNPLDAEFCRRSGCDETLRWHGERVVVDDPVEPAPALRPSIPPDSARPDPLDAVVTPSDVPAILDRPEAPRPRATVTPPRQRPGVGEEACPACATVNPIGLTFCSSCGEELPRAAAPAAKLSLADQLKAGAIVDDETLPGPGAARWWLSALAIVLLGGGAFALFGPPDLWQRVVHETEDSVERISGEAGVSVGAPDVSETAPALGRRLRDFAVMKYLVDGSKTSAWATSWVTPAVENAEPADGECSASDAEASGPGGDLVFAWDEPKDIERVQILGGLPADNSNAALYRRPTIVELRTDTGECVRRDLPGDADGDVVKFRFTGVSEVRVRIIAVSDVDSGGEFVAIREVKFVG